MSEPTKKPPKKPLRRRILKVAIILVLILVLVRIALPFVLPIVIDQVAGTFGLNVECEDISLSVLGGQVELSGIVVTPEEGGEEVARLNYARVDIRLWELITGAIHVNRVDVDGIDLHVVRKADGSIPLLDRFRPEPGGDTAPETPSSEGEAEERTDVDFTLPLQVDDLQAIDINLRVTDEAVTPTLDTTAHFTVILSNLGSPDLHTSYSALLRVDDILDSFRVHGSLEQESGGLRILTKLSVTNLEAAPLAVYLKPLGIDVLAEDIDLRLSAGLDLLPDPEDSTLGIARVEVSQFRARADGVTGARLGRAAVEIRGLGSNVTEFADVAVADVAASLLLDDQGDPVVLGIALRPAPPSTEPESEPEPEPALEPEPGPAHVIRIASATVENVRARFRDDTGEEPVDVQVIVEHLRAEDLTTDADTTGGKLEARITSPSVIESLELSGLVSPFVQPMTADLNLSIAGATPDPVRDWLDRIAIALPFERGDLRFRLVARADLSEPGVLGARVELTDVEFEADDTKHEVADAVSVVGTLAFPPRGLDLDFDIEGAGLDLTSTEPWLVKTGIEPLLTDARLGLHFEMKIRYLDDGMRMDIGLEDAALQQGEEESFRCDTFLVSGLIVDDDGTHIEKISGTAPSLRIAWDQRQTRLLGVGLSAPPPDTEEEEEKEAVADAGETDPPGDDAPTGFSIGEIALIGGDLVLRNDSREDAVDVPFLLDLTSDGMSIRGETLRAGFGVRVKAPENGTRTSVVGLLTREGPRLHAELDISGDELGGERLSSILPRGMTFSLEAGQFASKVTADLDTSVQGVNKIGLKATGVDLREAGVDTLVFGFDELKVAAEFHEGTEERPLHLDLDEVSLTGLQGELRLGQDGAMRFLGFTFSPVPPLPGTGEPTEKLSPEEQFAALLESRKGPPRLQVRKLLVGVDRLTVIDETPEAQPLVFEDIVITNLKPMDSAPEEDLAEGAPLNLAITAKASRFIGEVDVQATFRPFARPPSGEVHLLLDGIHGPEFMKALPSLAESVDLSEIEDGRFEAHAAIKMKYLGKSAMDHDFTRGFDAQITDVSLRNGDDPPLLTVEEIAASVTRLLPGRVDVSSVEIIAPRASVTIEKDGYRVLGVLLKKEEKAPDESDGADVAAAADTANEEPEPPETPKNGLVSTSSGLTVGNFYVSDLALDFRDESLNEEDLPPVHIPLIGTEIEVRGFRTEMEADDKMRFQVVARSDRIQLPDSDRVKPAFDEITIVGELGLEPKLTGWIRTSIIGLELTNFKGPARKRGVILDAGTFESGMGIRFREDGGMNLNSSIAFRDLSLSERENGFLYKLLKLPASTDTVLFLLRNHAGTIGFSFGLELPPGGEISTGRIASLAISKVSELIALAVLKSPLRVGAGIVGIVGIGAGEEEPEDPVVVGFRPGSTHLTREDRSAFAALVERMQDESDLVLTLEHELGRADLAPVETRFNPKPDECRALAQHLRVRQRLLIDERSSIEERARASLASGQRDLANEARHQLETIDRSIGVVAQELDQVLAILRRGADRGRDRRTRIGCITLGRMRIEHLARELVAAGITTDRIRYRRPRFVDPEIQAGGEVSIQPGRRIHTKHPEAPEEPTPAEVEGSDAGE